jgi:hypothetical protein
MPRSNISLVGLCPEKLHFVAEFQTTITYYFQRLTVNRGGAGWAQVRYGYSVTTEDVLESLLLINNKLKLFDSFFTSSRSFSVVFKDVIHQSSRANDVRNILKSLLKVPALAHGMKLPLWPDASTVDSASIIITSVT